MSDEVSSAQAIDLSENDLLAAVFVRVCEGSEDAFAELYDMTSARVHAVILGVVQAPDLASEITQDVYVEVWRQAARWSAAKGSVRAWMHTIAHRRAVDRVRSVQKATERDGRWAETVRDTERDKTWADVEQGLEAEGVRSALNELSPVQKEVIALAYYGGFTYREVAEMLGLPLGTVKTRIRDGLRGLRNAMRVQP